MSNWRTGGATRLRRGSRRTKKIGATSLKSRKRAKEEKGSKIREGRARGVRNSDTRGRKRTGEKPHSPVLISGSNVLPPLLWRSRLILLQRSSSQ